MTKNRILVQVTNSRVHFTKLMAPTAVAQEPARAQTQPAKPSGPGHRTQRMVTLPDTVWAARSTQAIRGGVQSGRIRKSRFH